MSSTWMWAQFLFYLAFLHLLLSNVHSGSHQKGSLDPVKPCRRILSIEDHVYFSQVVSHNGAHEQFVGAAAKLHTFSRTDALGPSPQPTAIAPVSPTTVGPANGLAPNAATTTVTSSGAPSSNPVPGRFLLITFYPKTETLCL
jgi:hypothetical protein